MELTLSIRKIAYQTIFYLSYFFPFRFNLYIDLMILRAIMYMLVLSGGVTTITKVKSSAVLSTIIIYLC